MWSNIRSRSKSWCYFYLIDTTGTVIQDLSFDLKAGLTTRMDCSESILIKFEEPTELYVQCGITGDASTAKSILQM